MTPGAIRDINFDPCNVVKDDSITIDNTGGGVALTANVSVANKVGALCSVETAPIRVTEDGATAPTTAAGTLYNVGDRFLVWGSLNLSNFKAIRTTGTSATLKVQWLGATN